MFARRFFFFLKRVEWTNDSFVLKRRTWAKKSKEEKTVEINPTVRKRNVISASQHIIQTVAWNKTPPNATRHRMLQKDDAKNERRMHTSKTRLTITVASDKGDGVWNLFSVRK